MVSGLGDRGYEERLRELKIPTLEARRAELDMVEMYKIMSGASDVDPTTWFPPAAAAEGGRVTRTAADPRNVRIPAARLDIRKHSFSVRVCDKWNNLPSSVKNSKNASEFKRAYGLLDGPDQAY